MKGNYVNDLEAAKMERVALLARLEVVNDFIDSYHRFTGQLSSRGKRKTRSKIHGRPALILNAVEESIRTAGVPLIRSAIVAALDSKGVEIPGADKERYIGTVIWRTKGERFLHIDGQGYTTIDMQRASE